MALAFMQKLTTREQRLVRVLGFVAFGIVFVGVPLGVESMLASTRSENADMRRAIDEMQGARAAIRDKQAKKDAIASRYAKRAPELGSFLEQGARKQKLDVTDNTDRPAVPIGKRYVERSTVIHVKKAGLLPLSRFFEGIEQSGSPVTLSRLNLRRRMGEPDAYDVEVGVTAWDRNEVAASGKPAASASAGKGP